MSQKKYQTATEFELSFGEECENSSVHPATDSFEDGKKGKHEPIGQSSPESRYGRIVACLLREASRLNIQSAATSNKQHRRYSQLPTDSIPCVTATVGMTSMMAEEVVMHRLSAGGTDDDAPTSSTEVDGSFSKEVYNKSYDNSADQPPGSISFVSMRDSGGSPPPFIVDQKALEFALQRVEALEEQLRVARLEMLEKDQKCESLIKLQTKVDNEVEELTGALFQEAYRMVHAAEERLQNTERLLVEARLKVDVLESEVLGLKQIVKEASRNSPARRPLLGSTPTSAANSRSAAIFRFLNNSLSVKSTDRGGSAKRSVFASTPLTTPNRLVSAAPQSLANGTQSHNETAAVRPFSTDGNEIDSICYREFVVWRENALGFDENCAFLRRIMHEDVEPCLVFENKDLSARILTAVKENRLEMEPYAPSRPSGGEEAAVVGPCNFRDCTLLGVRQPCSYRLRTAPDAEWHFISLLARNRVAAVGDFFTYVRYLSQGIVKPSTNDAYWTIVNLRKNMALAKLGLHFVLKMNGQGGAASSPSDSANVSPQHTGGGISLP